MFIKDVLKTVELMRALASLEGTISALKEKDALALSTRMKAMVIADPEIARAFVLENDGKIAGAFPTSTGSIGSFFGEYEALGDIVSEGKPYISGVYSNPGGRDVFLIYVPVLDKGNKTIGSIVFEHGTKQISDWLGNIRLSYGGQMMVFDFTGKVAAYPGKLEASESRLYEGLKPVQDALNGSLHTIRYRDPLIGEQMIATFVPLSVGSKLWVIASEQPVKTAYKSINAVKINIGLAGAVLTIINFALVAGLAKMSSRVKKLHAELSQKKDDFIGFVSHQLKAPIAALKWTLEMIISGDYGEIPKKMEAPIKEMQTVVDQNSRLVSDILNASRIDRGVIEVELKSTSLKSVAERAVRDYRIPAQKKGIRLILEESGPEIIVSADAEKFAEAVSNAVSNAIKHTNNGSITVSLRSDGDFGYIDVKDTGEGMDNDTIGKLFTRDKILGGSAKADRSAGLGLYIANQFMALQQGSIKVSSEIGKGSSFTYRIPLAKVKIA